MLMLNRTMSITRRAVMRITRIHFDEIGSTQDEAKDRVSELKIGEWRAYTADKQTKGRGTRQRTWISPPDNIYVTYSFLYKLSKIQPILSFFPQVAGYSVAEMLAEFK